MSEPTPEAEHTTRRSDLRAGASRSGGSKDTNKRRLPSVSGMSVPSVSLPKPQLPSGVVQAGERATETLAPRIEGVVERTRPAWSPVLEFLRWISPLGWTILGLGVLGWFIGARYGWTEWMMIAGAALGLLLCCMVLAIGRTRVTITTEVDPVRVTVGDPATGRVEVVNDSKRGMLPLLVELPVGVSAARFTLPPLGSGKAHEELFVVPTNRRGVIPVGPASTVQGDPLGLVRRTLRWTDITDLYVHPRTVSLESIGAGLLRDLEGEATQDLSMSDLAFHALREYQPGDDRRYIHWRSSAKAGRLLVRQFLDTRRSHLNVIVDTDPACYRHGDDDVETAISAAASLAVRAIMDEQDTTVVCGAERASRTTGSLTLDALSRAEIGARDLFSQAGDAFALAPDTSIAIIVTGHKRPFIEVQRALGQFELEVNKVVLTVDEREQTGVKRIGGLTLLTVQKLEDLQSVLVAGAVA